MGIGVQVQEYGGQLVDQVAGTDAVAALCALAAAEPGRYPLLAGVDPLDDTYFNARQAVALTVELRAIAEQTNDEPTRTAATDLLRLAALLEAAPGRPHHRRLHFNGD